MDAKPMGGEGPVAGGLAGRRNVPCPTLVKQENVEAPIRIGGVPNGFPGGSGVCPPRGNLTSNCSMFIIPLMIKSPNCTTLGYFVLIGL